MLEQTKRAVDNLKACGLDRKDFRVRVTYTKAGEYGDLFIVIFKRTELLLPFTEKLAQHFSVDQYIEKGKVRSMFVHEGNPGLHKYYVDREEEVIICSWCHKEVEKIDATLIGVSPDEEDMYWCGCEQEEQ